MGGFDWVILAILLVSVLVGVMRGFIKEALSLASWVIALWLSITFCREAGDYIASFIDIPVDVFRISAGFALIFIVTLFAFAIVTFVITKLFVRGPIKATDRVLGVGFGAIRAGAIVVAVVLVVRGIGLDKSDWWENSQYLPYFVPAADYIEPLLPKQLQANAEGDANLEQQVIKQALKNIQIDDANSSVESVPATQSITQ